MRLTDFRKPREEITEGFKIDKKAIDDVMSDRKLIGGFEFEFAFGLIEDGEPYIEEDEDGNWVDQDENYYDEEEPSRDELFQYGYLRAPDFFDVAQDAESELGYSFSDVGSPGIERDDDDYFDEDDDYNEAIPLDDISLFMLMNNAHIMSIYKNQKWTTSDYGIDREDIADHLNARLDEYATNVTEFANKIEDEYDTAWPLHQKYTFMREKFGTPLAFAMLGMVPRKLERFKSNDSEIRHFVEAAYDPDDISEMHEFADILNSIEGIIIPRIGFGQDEWRFVEDSSVKSDHGGGEITSETMPIKDLLNAIKETFTWASDRNHSTNNTTGFHVSMSYESPEVTAHADLVKLVVLLDDDHILREFKRLNNEYTKSQMVKLRKEVRRLLDNSEDYRKSENLAALLKELRKTLSTDKYSSVNIGKLESQGYLEFRIMGGKSYHEQFDLISRNILKYAVVLKASVDPNAYRRQFLTKLYRLIDTAVSDHDNESRASEKDDVTYWNIKKYATPKGKSELTHTLDSYVKLKNAAKEENKKWVARAFIDMLSTGVGGISFS